MARERSARAMPQSRRVPMGASETRGSRETADNEKHDDGLEVPLEVREQMLRDDAMQNQLPTPPKRPGLHWFYASLTNPYTSVQWYLRMGYRPVKYSELEGWADANMRGKSGTDYADCIVVNEMLLMKIDDKTYQRFMAIQHHEKPMQEQQRMRESFQRVREEVAMESGQEGLVIDATGKGEVSGLPTLNKTARKPRQFE